MSLLLFLSSVGSCVQCLQRLLLPERPGRGQRQGIQQARVWVRGYNEDILLTALKLLVFFGEGLQDA